MTRTPFRDLIESRHPHHESRRAFWRLAWQSFQGGADYLTASNLFSHRLEHAADHRRRLARAFHLNYCRPVVDTYVASIFRVGPTILPEAGASALLADADGRGHGLVDVMKRALTLAAVYGHVVIGVDRPRTDARPATVADELALGLRSYLYLVQPSDFLNWNADGAGGLEWALVRERRRDVSRTSAGTPADGERTRYRLWTANGWTLIDETGECVDEGDHPFGRVPFVSCRFREGDDPVVGESLLSSIVYVNREIFNLGSLLGEILYRQTFSQLVAEGSAAEYGENGDISRLGTSSIFLYPEGRRAPEFINPDAAQADLLMRRIDALIDEIYRLASLSRGSAREGRVQSGISKAFDFLDTNHALADAADNLARAFERALAIAAPDWNARIRFPGDFGVSEPSALLDETERTLGLGVGPVFRRRVLERLARAVLRELPADQRGEVLREIATESDTNDTTDAS